MITRTADESKNYYEKAMGIELGSIFYALTCEVSLLCEKWTDYVSLFGTNEARIDLLNRASPSFFGRMQETIWDDLLLRIARLTDPPESGRGRQPNLTLKRVAKLLDPELTTQISELSIDLDEKASFCRNVRNKRLAHNDLNLSLGRSAHALDLGSRHMIKELLSAFTGYLSYISAHYTGSGLAIDGDGPGNDSYALLCVIDDGLRELEQRDLRVKSGNFCAADFAKRDF